MKVVYKKTILDEIKAAGNNAALMGRDIEHVEISVKEARQLIRELDSLTHYSNPMYTSIDLANFELWLNDFDIYGRAPVAPPLQPSLRAHGVDVKVVGTFA